GLACAFVGGLTTGRPCPQTPTKTWHWPLNPLQSMSQTSGIPLPLQSSDGNGAGLLIPLDAPPDARPAEIAIRNAGNSVPLHPAGPGVVLACCSQKFTSLMVLPALSVKCSVRNSP